MVILAILLILALAAFLAYALLYALLFRAPLPDAIANRMTRRIAAFAKYRDRIDLYSSALKQRLYSPETMVSADGTRLSGRYYHSADGAPLLMLFHGYRGDPMNFFPGIAEHFLNNGLNVLIVDQRAHGDSGGHVITMGVQERIDVLNWVDYAAHRFGNDTRTVLFGVSMGAASVLMASEFSQLRGNCIGIIADCPFTTPEAVIRRMARKKTHLSDAFIWSLIRSAASFFGHFDLTEVSTVDAVRHSHIPTLLLHGESDALVPCEMSAAIQSANPNMIERHTVPDAGHAGDFYTDEARYLALLDAFLNRIGA